MAVTWKLAAGKTWKQKLTEEHPNHGKVVPIPPGMRKQYGTGTMLIPRPADVAALMRKVPKGKVVTVSQIRAKLAADAESDQACPLSTGIFIRIVAEAAEEDRRAGKKRITPYWRTIRDDGTLNDKYPGGVKPQAAHLRDDGLTIEPTRRSKRPRVSDFEARRAKL